MNQPTEPLRIGIRGAKGRMGQEAARAVHGAPDLRLVAEIDLGDDPETCFRAATVQVALDFTRPEALPQGVPAMLRAGAAVVVGTSGVQPAQLAAWSVVAEECGRPVLVVPNFCLGVVLMQRFATMAARFYRDVEIVELHHERKVDSPSGTAADTARRIARTRGPTGNRNADRSAFRGGIVEEVPVHSIRLPGLLAHQEVLFGGDGEVLTIRHDTSDRSAFMPGVLLALRRVRHLAGVHVGLETCLPDLTEGGSGEAR